MSADHYVPPSSWLRSLHKPSGSTNRLIYLPYAGGGAGVYSRWVPFLPDALELLAVQYPGREDRLEENPPDSIRSIARRVAVALQWFNDKPYSIFGHSMGSVVAYETCRFAEMLGVAGPEELVVAAGEPPDRLAVGDLSGASVGRAMTSSAGTDTHGEHGAVGSPTANLEHDLELLADYAGLDVTSTSVRVPIVVLTYEDDPDIDTDAVRSWSSRTERNCRYTVLPGDHFSCFTDPGRTICEITSGA
ncbi:thioesterase II family protein [Actinopolyspora erythraea]|uniref:thioesterase II family protein n=1 Tax=Actinopolyspora erythraea TaxID=414996 RepID=UPI00178CAB81|nr:alpha/beta fold hydrolase [Actinopolyspora erythraea]